MRASSNNRWRASWERRHQVVYTRHEDIGRIFPHVICIRSAILRTSPAPMYLLSELVRQNHYKVVLTGEGADEFLAGYDIFKEAQVRRFWARRPNPGSDRSCSNVYTLRFRFA